MRNKAVRFRQLRMTLLFALLVFGIQVVAVGIMLLCLHLLVTGHIINPERVNQIPLMYFLFTSVLIGTVLAVMFGKRPLKPLNEIMDATDRIAGGDYSARIHLGGPHEFKQLSERFNHMAEELGSVEMLRSDFINDFSHEFKTPIVSIRGFAKMLKLGDLTDAERDEYLDIILRESERLTDLSTNVLMLNKLEKQAILTDVADFNLTEQVRRAVALLAGKWGEKHLDIALNSPEVYYSGNRELLDQVWINLLDNAVKYSPPYGTITLKVQDGDGAVRVMVVDEGHGMPPEVSAHIFDKFYQGDPSRATKGNGLGLAIAQRIVELHGGRIDVSSVLDIGSSFSVILPVH